MKKRDELIKIYSGNEPLVFLLKEKLEEIGIQTLVKNDSSSAFLLTFQAAIELYINESDLMRAEPVISKFLSMQQG